MQKEAQQEHEDPDRYYADEAEELDEEGNKIKPKRKAPPSTSKGRGRGRGRGQEGRAQKKSKAKPPATQEPEEEDEKPADEQVVYGPKVRRVSNEELKRKATALLCSPQRRKAVLKRALSMSPHGKVCPARNAESGDKEAAGKSDEKSQPAHECDQALQSGEGLFYSERNIINHFSIS